MRKWFLGLMSLVWGLGLVGCASDQGQTEPQGLTIVTSFYPIYALTKEVSGDLNQVELMASQQGIHGFEPSVTAIKEIADADAFIYHLDSLETWSAAVKANLENRPVAVLEAGKELDMVRVPGLEQVKLKPGQSEASLLDPHTWTDPLLLADEAQAIADFLGQLDPENQAIYAQRANAFEQEAKGLVASYQPKFEGLTRRAFVTQHTAFAYLARRFGLEQLGVAGLEDQEPSPRQLAQVKDFVSQRGIGTIFVEEGQSDKLAQTLAQATGATIEELATLERPPAEAQPILRQLEANLQTLLTSLSEEEER